MLKALHSSQFTIILKVSSLSTEVLMLSMAGSCLRGGGIRLLMVLLSFNKLHRAGVTFLTISLGNC